MRSALLGFALFLSGSIVTAADYSPPIANDYPTRLLWGDTHVHSYLSPDAFTFGNRTITPEQAFRFARGEAVTSQGGLQAKLSRPLDFLLVSDHAEYLGVFPKVFSGSEDILATPLGQRWGTYLKENQATKVLMEFGILSMGTEHLEHTLSQLDDSMNLDADVLRDSAQTSVPEPIKQSIWNNVGAVADQFNEPGRFTAFIGYEWTSMPGGNNLHRNVLFRDAADKTSQVLPFSSIDGGDPEQLWKFLGEYEEKTGGKVLAIPHNSNVSNGLMFAETTLGGDPLSAEYAERRSRWEPVIEVTQIKGDSEAHPFLSPDDEFADYETWDKANLSFNAVKQQSMLKHEYARSALKIGLAQEAALGENPFKFGMIGSTDSHTSLATADEDNYFGKMSSAEPEKDRAYKSFFPQPAAPDQIQQDQWESAASGYAAVWAKDNTREDIFDAMQRKEVYATTGPRMTVRFFAGWNFAATDAHRPDRASHGYRNGVPMGADLPVNASADSAPTFLVAAQKDPLGANLDRLQIVKSWLDENGETHEKVINVAASDERPILNNKVRPVGNTVDTETATYLNSIGDAELAVVWTDAEFDPNQSAVYYARVMEIPTPRWTHIDEVFFKSQAPEQAPEWTQERAYTSPIWYTPESSDEEQAITDEQQTGDAQ
ncbi:MAG: DUF3604 domain-containing protein [Pseudomonadales bacterium]